MAIPYITAFDFDYGEAAQVSPLIQRVIADNPGPFTFTGTGVYIVGSNAPSSAVSVIDPGPATEKHIAALDIALEGRRVSHVLLTHHHADHSPLAKPLAEKHGCKVYGHSVQPTEQADTQITLEAGHDSTFKPDVEIRDGDIIKGEGWTIETLHTPGHTSNHLCFALQEENTLFSGDHIMGWATSVVSPPDGHMGDYLNSLQRVLDRNFDVIRPTHGAEITEVRTFVQAYIDHRLQRESQILNAVTSGLSHISDIVADLYQHVDKRLHPAAAHSVLSHMIHLRETGHVKTDGLDGLNRTYLPA